MISYNINRIFVEEKIYQLEGQKFENDFLTVIFLTMVSHLMIHLQTQNYQYLIFLWREPCLTFLIHVLVFVLRNVEN